MYPRNETEAEWNFFFSALTKREALKDCLDLMHVLLLGPGEDQDIVQVHKHVLVEHVPQHVIDQGLEHDRGVGEPEKHHQILIVTSGVVEGRLPLIDAGSQRLIKVQYVSMASYSVADREYRHLPRLQIDGAVVWLVWRHLGLAEQLPEIVTHRWQFDRVGAGLGQADSWSAAACFRQT